MILEFQKGIKSVIKECMSVAWYSRGSIQYETALEFTPIEREIAMGLVSENIKSQAKNEGTMRTLVF